MHFLSPHKGLASDKGQNMDEDAEDRQRIATLLHEIRQPLNMIALSCNNIQNRARLQNGNLNEEYLIAKMNAIMDAVRNSAGILDDIHTICNKSR
jgi:signal transduction histidine kinase